MRLKILCLVLFISCIFTACAPLAETTRAGDVSANAGGEADGANADSAAGYGANAGGGWSVSVTDSEGSEIWNFTEAELAETIQKPGDAAGGDTSDDATGGDTSDDAIGGDASGGAAGGAAGKFAHAYSTVNNWPAARFYAADGYTVTSVLLAAGVYDTAQTVAFAGQDGYEVSLTRSQLLAPQFYYPNVNENGGDAETVYPIIAYRWREGADDVSLVREEAPCLIFGQRTPFEQTNPAFVVKLARITVYEGPCERWPEASAFPAPGPIAAGEAVKLQHGSIGTVKIYYTLDGSEPTAQSRLYNPSAYQPELNKPIRIEGPTVIKALVCGYGKEDSGIAVLEYDIFEQK